jgi:mRNA interferase MazF
MAFNRGDVVLVPFPAADLRTTKTRPAVVVNSTAFTAGEGRLLIAGITSNLAAHRNATSFVLRRWARAGLKQPSVVTTWLACIAARIVVHRVGALSDPEMAEVGKRLRAAMDL